MSGETNWITAALADELQDGQSKSLVLEGSDIALFREGDEYFAIANECAHHGAPLHDGRVKNGAVSCPWHGWQFDLQTGECLTAPGCNIETYEVRIEEGQVKVAVS
jgi:nitrite reductase (NADH) small subunit